MQVDALDLTDEASWSNKFLSTAITVQPASLLPQLAITSLTAPSSATPGQNIQVSYAVTNQGGSSASGPWFDALVLSTNGAFDGAIGILGFWTINGPVAAGVSYSSTQNVVLPNAPTGSYFLVLNVDFAQSVNQSSRAENVLSVPITLGTSVVVNPTPISLVGATLLASGAIQFTFTNTPGVSFRVFATADLSLPLSTWTLLGNVTETSPGEFQFIDARTSAGQTRFYRVRSP